MPLPNLIVIGAMKCGTTALHGYLDAHPDIAMAGRKEMNFFVGPDAAHGDGWHAGTWHRGLGWYASHFGDAPVRGEASPAYTSPRHAELAAARMASVVPGASLVLLARDPVDRAVSQYTHHHDEGTETRPMAEALLDPESQYVGRGRYFARLEPYLSHFDSERVAVVLAEDLRARRRETLASLFRFAGVADDFWCDAVEERRHVGSSAPSLDAALEASLVEAFADDVEELRRLTRRSLSEWRSYERPSRRSRSTRLERSSL